MNPVLQGKKKSRGEKKEKKSLAPLQRVLLSVRGLHKKEGKTRCEAATKKKAHLYNAFCFFENVF
jgi:hypothetical protein